MEDIKLEVKNKNLEDVISQAKDIKLNADNVIQTLHSIMEIVEKISKDIKGADKKQLALDSIKYLLSKQTDISEKDKILIATIIDQVGPSAIDIIISVSNGLSALVKTSSLFSLCPCFK